MKAKDLTGMKFGRLTVIERRGSNSRRNALWLCHCECGNEKIISGASLVHGHTNSCGCLHSELAREQNTTHGKTNSRLYAIWRNMKARCYNGNNENYKYYGARGITVCDEWRNNFEAFQEWAFANGYDNNARFGECTLDRIDVNGHYCPTNCRWATIDEQNKNRRNCKKVGG